MNAWAINSPSPVLISCALCGAQTAVWPTETVLPKGWTHVTLTPAQGMPWPRRAKPTPPRRGAAYLAELQRLWQTGHTAAEIATHLGTTRATVYDEVNRMRKAGWDLPYRSRGESTGQAPRSHGYLCPAHAGEHLP